MRLNLNEKESKSYDSALVDFNKSVSGELLNICESLFEIFKVDFFEYHKFYDDHSFFYISTNEKWHELYLQKYSRCSLIINHIKKVFNEKIRYYILTNNLIHEKKDGLGLFINDMNQHDIYNCLYIYIHYGDAVEVFSFGTSVLNHTVINTYFNNLDILYRFITFFCEKAEKIIGVLNNNENPSSEKGFLIHNNQNLKRQEQIVEKFLKATEINRYPVLVKDNVIYLTPRQIQCVYYLTKGRAYKEIGEILSIGAKAVEAHLTLARLKMGCLNNSSLIKIFENNKVLSNMFFMGR